ncbi:MAG: tetratricopeptide repeat protein [Candidatus Hydrogenedentota bacterium]
MAFGGDNAESYYDEGITASMRGDYTLAIDFFQKAVQCDSNYLPAFQQMAKCHLRLGNASKAVKILREVLAVKPGQVPSRLDLGFALIEQGHPEEARKQFTEVLNQKPQNARAHLGLAQCSFEEGQWSAAAELARSALNLGGANFAALLLLGRAAGLAGVIEESIDALQRADSLMEKSIESNPDAPEGYFLRGEVHLAREDFTSALENFRAAEDRAEPEGHYSAFGISFDRTDALAKQGVCLQRLGRIQPARELGERILKFNPDHKLGAALAALQPEN